MQQDSLKVFRLEIRVVGQNLLRGHAAGQQRQDKPGQLLPTTVGEIQAELDDYLAYYNCRRPHMAPELLYSRRWFPEGLRCVDRLQSFDLIFRAS